jgi:hypothetical protein
MSTAGRGKISPAQGTLTLETRIAAWPKLVHTVDWLRFFPNLGAVFLPIESSEVWLYLWYFFAFFPTAHKSPGDMLRTPVSCVP